MLQIANAQKAPETTTVDDLTRLGFTAEQIGALQQLRAIYPLVELVDSNQQIEQLRFLRWLHLRTIQTA
jgi:hypothetical protein